MARTTRDPGAIGTRGIRSDRPAVVETDGLGRTFGRVRVLSGISLKIEKGEIFGVLGADGAGKTTLMQMLAAILDPTEGRCRVLGFDSVREADSITSRIGYMSQGFTLYDRLTVDENMFFFASLRGLKGKAWRQQKKRLLEMAGLERFGGRRAGRLSGGMRKKLSLCTNLIHQPPLLLLDEPTLGVDPGSRRDLWNILRAFREDGTTVVVTTPYMNDAEQCDRLALLDRGELVLVDSPEGLKRRKIGAVLQIETPNPEPAREVLRAIPDIIDLQWLSDRLRFQLRPGRILPEARRSELARLGAVTEPEPNLDDIVIALTPGGESAGSTPAETPEHLPRTSGSGAVAIEDVGVQFGAFTAVDGVSLSIPAGQIFGFLGPNGAGKTTLIKVLCGLIKPAAGDVRVADVDVVRTPLAVRERIGYVSQRFSLYPDLTVAENLYFFGGAYGLAGTARSAAIGWAKDMTGLSGMEERRVSHLSGALRQRLALACSVLHRPRVLFLDEPTSGVAPLARHMFWELIHILAAEGVTVLVTTHYMEEAVYCDRLGLMFQGRFVAVGNLDQFRADLGGRPDLTMDDMFVAFIERERGPERAAVS